MRTQYGSHVAVIGKDPEDDTFLYLRRDDGSELWGHVSNVSPQDDADLELLTDRGAVPDAPDYAL